MAVRFFLGFSEVEFHNLCKNYHIISPVRFSINHNKHSRLCCCFKKNKQLKVNTAQFRRGLKKKKVS